jgi:copper chaperone CopZ
MKTLHLCCLLLTAEPALAQEPRPEATRGTYVIRGLHCPPCTTTVASALKKAPGVQSVKVDWTTKNAWVDFDERVLSAQQVARLIATTPHMMGRNMRYAGLLALKVPELGDDESAAKAVAALKQVPGVSKVTPYVKQHSVTVEFAGQGDVTTLQLIEALGAAGMEAASFR